MVPQVGGSWGLDESSLFPSPGIFQSNFPYSTEACHVCTRVTAALASCCHTTGASHASHLHLHGGKLTNFAWFRDGTPYQPTNSVTAS